MRWLYGHLVRLGWLRRLVLSIPGLRQLAWRFVAGEGLESGVATVRKLNLAGIHGSLNYVGTHVRDPAEAEAAADQAIEALHRISAEELQSHISVKPTQIGLDISEAFCRRQLWRVLETAKAQGGFVRIDMEEFRYVDSTLAIFEEALPVFGADTVGIVIQSYLVDRAGDLTRVLAQGASVRLCKGGYWEPGPTYQDKSVIDRRFSDDLASLLQQGSSPAVATHDEEFIARSIELARQLSLDKGDFEFQMLYGVRPDLQERLVKEGFRVRCYVPYGGDWLPYFLGNARRLAKDSLTRRRRRSGAPDREVEAGA